MPSTRSLSNNTKRRLRKTLTPSSGTKWASIHNPPQDKTASIFVIFYQHDYAYNKSHRWLTPRIMRWDARGQLWCSECGLTFLPGANTNRIMWTYVNLPPLP